MNIVGIDLGTTFSAISALNTIGKPEIVPNSDSDRIMHSAIYFENESEIIVGTEARNNAEKNQQNFARWIKRDMGEEYYSKKILGKDWSPAVLSSIILKKLSNEFESQKGKIDYCVITVPAYFDETRRRATLDAGKLAGLNVLGIINEPTAAALYYATNNQIHGKIMVFDLGGGTFDVTVLDVSGQNIDIISTLGDHRLGGYDFDMVIIKKMMGVYQEQVSSVDEYDFMNDADIETEAESIKKKLSKAEAAKVSFVYAGIACTFEYSRQEFENSISPLMARIEMLVESVLDEKEMSSDEINEILLVGGSTRMPVIDRIIKNVFNKTPLRIGNVDECVALGASIYCGLQVNENNPNILNSTIVDELSRVKLQEVCTHSYGTSVISFNQEMRSHRIMNDILIPKNTRIPIQIERTYVTTHANQQEIIIDVTQGEGTDSDMVNTIAKDKLMLPPNRPEGMQILVNFSYDKNQIMKCEFIDLDSKIKKTMNIDIKTGHHVSDEMSDIVKMFNIE